MLMSIMTIKAIFDISIIRLSTDYSTVQLILGFFCVFLFSILIFRISKKNRPVSAIEPSFVAAILTFGFLLLKFFWYVWPEVQSTAGPTGKTLIFAFSFSIAITAGLLTLLISWSLITLYQCALKRSAMKFFKVKPILALMIILTIAFYVPYTVNLFKQTLTTYC